MSDLNIKSFAEALTPFLNLLASPHQDVVIKNHQRLPLMMQLTLLVMRIVLQVCLEFLNAIDDDSTADELIIEAMTLLNGVSRLQHPGRRCRRTTDDNSQPIKHQVTGFDWDRAHQCVLTDWWRAPGGIVP